MIIYSGTLGQFDKEVMEGGIADLIEQCLIAHGLGGKGEAEYRSWNNSLRCIRDALTYENKIDRRLRVAVEFQIPQTSKRVDFIVSGLGRDVKTKNAVIVELKQWDHVEATDMENVVETFVGGANRHMAHPSYQAYSYCQTIKAFNLDAEDIELSPCAYLHNLQPREAAGIWNPKYRPILDLSPSFIANQAIGLRDFIRSKIWFPDQGETIEAIDSGRIGPTKSLQEAVGEMMEGNQAFYLLDEQKVAYETILDYVERVKGKTTIIVEGGPGTGKSVIAINLLARLIKEGKTTAYVSKNAAPRSVYAKELSGGHYTKGYVNTLFKGSGSFVDCHENAYSALLVDEAHRLGLKSGLFQNKGENQMREIIHASRVSVFFIDERQRISSKDYGSIAAIEEGAAKENSHIVKGDGLKLLSQFRCNGSDAYLSFVDSFLDGKNAIPEDLDFDFRLYTDPCRMRKDLRLLNEADNRSRMLSGYTFDWISKAGGRNAPYDIVLSGGFKARWNLGSTQTWAIDPDSFEEVGCIHTSQGLEFSYVGVIIGLDMHMDEGKLVYDPKKRAKTDQSLKGIASHGGEAAAMGIIRNTYRTLLTRGQKGCFVYIQDPALREKLKSALIRSGHADRIF